MKRIIREILATPIVNRILRKAIKVLSIGSDAFFKRLKRYVHVSGKVQVVVGNHLLTLRACSDDALASKLYYDRDWETHTIFWYSKFCTTNRVILDAGANIGIFSMLAAKLNTRAIVHAFEPNPYNFSRLQKNIALNCLEGRVTAHQIALGKKTGEISFFLPAESRISDVSSVYRTHSTFFNDFAHQEIQVPCVSLEEFCKDRGLTPEIVKIDVELYELQVLEGMKSILISARPLLFCEIFNDEVKRKLNPQLDAELENGYTTRVHEFLQSVGYHSYLIIPEGILRVDSLKGPPSANMFLLLPRRLKQSFYLSAEADLVLDELSGG